MANQVTWYKDETTWLRFKELCEDKDHFGPSFNEWVTAVQKKIDELATQGVILVKVETDPEKYATWCKTNGHPLNGMSRGLYLQQCFTDNNTKH